MVIIRRGRRTTGRRLIVPVVPLIRAEEVKRVDDRDSAPAVVVAVVGPVVLRVDEAVDGAADEGAEVVAVLPAVAAAAAEAEVGQPERNGWRTEGREAGMKRRN